MPIEPNIATTRRPSVTGVEFAWLALVCRLTFGAPLNAVALPQDLAGRLVQAVDLPGVLGEIVDRRDVAVEPGPEGLVAGAADGASRRTLDCPRPPGWRSRCRGSRSSSGRSAGSRRPIRPPLPVRRRCPRRCRRGSRASCAPRSAGRAWLSAGGAAGGVAAGAGGGRRRSGRWRRARGSTPAACCSATATARSIMPPRPSKLIDQAFAFDDAKAGRRDRD